jgi:hypothetical protein
MSTVTMQELELETAELLPARETLNCHKSSPSSSSSSVTTIIAQSGQGNTQQTGNGDFSLSFLNGLGSGNTAGLIAL